MSASQWKQAWENGEIDFHQTQINPQLKAWLPRLGLTEDARIFVPMCGKSQDMAWLLTQKLCVTGVEISPIALAAFFEANAMIAHSRQEGRLCCWQAGPISLFCGDIFKLRKEDLADVAAVYDRAALLALSPPMRRRYVRHLHSILPAQCSILLITTEYPEAAEADPPFTVASEILALYQETYSIELLHTERGFETHPGEGQSGLQATQEKIHLLRRRPPH